MRVSLLLGLVLYCVVAVSARDVPNHDVTTNDSKVSTLAGELSLPTKKLLQVGTDPEGAPAGDDKYAWQREIINKAKVDNRVIVCGANYGFRSWVQQWYVSLKRTGVTEIVIIALDRQMYDWAVEKVGQEHVVYFELIDDASVAGDAHRWRSKSYKKVVSQRACILKPIIEMGVDVLYADTDITWYASPWAHIPEGSDMYVQQEKSEVIGDYNCSGFIFIRASDVTRKFMEVWEQKIIERAKKPGFFTDQEEMNFLFQEIFRGKRKKDVEWKGFKASVLPAAKFPTGIQYYFKREKAPKPKKGSKPSHQGDCELGKECIGFTFKPLDKPLPKWKKAPPVIVHHNYIKGNAEKVLRAKKAGLWLHLRDDEFE